MRTLNVKATTKYEVEKKWGFTLPWMLSKELYIRCNAKGEVNWDKAPIISAEKLVKRGNYKVQN